jgi:hypothetical protein
VPLLRCAPFYVPHSAALHRRQWRRGCREQTYRGMRLIAPDLCRPTTACNRSGSSCSSRLPSATSLVGADIYLTVSSARTRDASGGRRSAAPYPRTRRRSNAGPAPGRRFRSASHCSRRARVATAPLTNAVPARPNTKRHHEVRRLGLLRGRTRNSDLDGCKRLARALVFDTIITVTSMVPIVTVVIVLVFQCESASQADH